MFLRRFGLSVAVPAIVVFTSLAVAAAQSDEDAGFVPVTDAMLEDPAPGDWLMWRRTQNGWGYSPLDQVNRDNVGDLQLVWSRALAAGAQEGTPLAYGGVLFMPNPKDHLQAIDAVTGDLLWEYRRDIPEDVPEIMGGLTDNNRNVAIYGRTIIDTSNDDYVYALDAVTGELAWETQIFDYQVHPARHSSGPIIAGRQGHLRAELPPAGRSGLVRHRRARRRHRRGAVADEPRAGAGRAGRRDLGRRAVRGTDACRLVDGPELRRRPRPDLRRHLRHVAGAEVHARRRRQQAPLPQLDPRARRRDGGDPLVLPAPERPLGSRSPLRAHPGRHGGRAGRGRGVLDEPAAPAERQSAGS